ncbi:hypothetical protein J6590_056222 [Homalodisca vitripennis]|nr:hypothetical protein J6590_056222 [Homalodisca vitripennis]
MLVYGPETIVTVLAVEMESVNRIWVPRRSQFQNSSRLHDAGVRTRNYRHGSCCRDGKCKQDMGLFVVKCGTLYDKGSQTLAVPEQQ